MIQGMGRKQRNSEAMLLDPLLYHTLLNAGKDTDSGVRPASV